MEATDTTAADDDEQANAPIEALAERLAEQAEHQENFQTFLRSRSDSDADAAEQFQQDLIKFIKANMAAEHIGLSEAAVTLWEQVALMEQNLRESGDDGSDRSAGSQQDDSRGVTREEADPGLPNDPAFQ